MSTDVPRLLTVGEMSKALNVPLHRIEYALKSRRIKPQSWAGHSRVYTEADLACVRGILAQIDAARGC